MEIKEKKHFKAFIGQDQRICVASLPKDFTHEEWEILDELLNDESQPDFGLTAEESGFYNVGLNYESGFEDESEWGFSFGELYPVK